MPRGWSPSASTPIWARTSSPRRPVLGRRLDALSVPTTEADYEKIVNWAEGLQTGAGGGDGSYGTGLARSLQSRDVEVIEVNRPKRMDRRRVGKKSDPIDDEAATRTVLAATVTRRPKDGHGKVEMVRTLRTARRSAVKACSQAANQLKALLVPAPEEFRARLRRLSKREFVATAACFRPGDRIVRVVVTPPSSPFVR